jgi:hypothetical protein
MILALGSSLLMKRLPWAVATMVIVAFLFACGEVEEVGMGNDSPEQEMSVREILSRVEESMSSAGSYRVVSLGSSSDAGTRRSETISVRGDTFTRDDEPNREESLFYTGEKLFYRGKEYGRDESHSWVPIEDLEKNSMRIPLDEWVVTDGSVGVGTLGEEPRSNTPEHWAGHEFGVNAYFSDVSAVQRLSDEDIDGRKMLRLYGESSSLTGATDLEAMFGNQLGMSINDLLPDARAEFAKVPDTLVQQTTIWVSPLDFLVSRVEVRGSGLRDGKIVYTFEDTTNYSDHGTAELPGPLPDA